MGFFQILFLITLGIILSLWYAVYRILKTVEDNRKTLNRLSNELKYIKAQLPTKSSDER
jgi:hypothetical protein